MRCGLLILLLSTLTVFEVVRSDNEVDKVTEIVKDIREILTGAREGVPADYLETATKDLAADIDAFIAASGVEVTDEEANTVIGQIAEAVASGVDGEENPLKFQITKMAKGFRLLKGMADKLEEIQQSGSTENLYETLVATQTICLAIVGSIDNIDSVIEVVGEMQGNKREAADDEKDARRKWCVGWDRRALVDSARDVSKRRWCVGWEKSRRHMETREETPDKRKWCVGWDNRAVHDPEKRRWCVGWEKRSLAVRDETPDKRKWCVGWGKRDVHDPEKRKWCIGSERRNLATREAAPAKRKWCVGWVDRSVQDPEKRRWCVGWERRSVIVREPESSP